MRRKEQHSPYHNLFANLRVGEAVRLLVFDWDTICPHQEKAESDTDDDRLVTRIENWNTLFGENADLESVLSIIFRRYVRLRKDKYKIRKVLHDAFVCGYIDKKEERYFLHILKNS